MNFEVEITKEATEFILSLPIKFQAKIQRTIGLLKEFGYTLSEPHAKKLKSYENIYELRVIFGSNICRLFYFHFKNQLYIVTSGYIKKRRETDKKQITKAIKIMKIIKEKYNEKN